MIQFLLFFTSIFFLFPTAYIRATSNDDSLYALSSLHYHIYTLSTSSLEDVIHFEPEDVAHLWDKASTNPLHLQAVQEAYLTYTQALTYSQECDTFKTLCDHACFCLEKARHNLLSESKQPDALISFAKSAVKSAYQNFDDNPFLSAAMKQRIKPHLISPKHFAKKYLDTLFKHENPLRNSDTFYAAGFKKVAKHSSQCTVAKHPALGHYLAKLYLFDVLPNKQNLLSWEALCTRCESAEAIRALIKKHRIKYFLVPDKWIYVLPPHILAHASPEEHLHPILLVVENMDLVGQRKSAEAWRTKISQRHLKELYCLLSNGYGSAKLIQNIPYTTHHKFALIDTEYPKRVVDYAKVKRFINAEMQQYWDELVRKGQCPL